MKQAGMKKARRYRLFLTARARTRTGIGLLLLAPQSSASREAYEAGTTNYEGKGSSFVHLGPPKSKRLAPDWPQTT